MGLLDATHHILDDHRQVEKVLLDVRYEFDHSVAYQLSYENDAVQRECPNLATIQTDDLQQMAENARNWSVLGHGRTGRVMVVAFVDVRRLVRRVGGASEGFGHQIGHVRGGINA